MLARGVLPAGLIRLPDWMVIPFADWINAVFAFMRDEMGLMHVTRAFAAVVEWLLDVTANLLYGKSRWPRIGPMPWLVDCGHGLYGRACVARLATGAAVGRHLRLDRR